MNRSKVGEPGSWIRDGNRTENASQVKAYCQGGSGARRMRRPPAEMWSRMFIASVVAILLQWGTTGAAVIPHWFSPATGMSSSTDE